MSGIGPKVALAVVSGSPPGELRRAIALGDHARFQAIPGIGKKTAERIVLELKEKLGARRGRSASRARRRRARHISSRATRSSSSATRVRRRGAGARGGRSRAAGRGARPARAQRRRPHDASQFAAPPAARGPRKTRPSARSARAGSTTSSARSGSRSSSRIALDAARARGEALDHVLLAGPPGLGKTTLAQIVREELGVGLRTSPDRRSRRRTSQRSSPRSSRATSSSSTRSTGSTARPRRSSTRRSRTSGSTSSSARAPAARTLTLDLPPFTLVGATTRTGLLTTPLRDRFGMTFRLGYYDPGQLATIVRRSARNPRRRDRGRRGRRDRVALARHAAHREPDPAARAGRRGGAARGRDHHRRRAEALELLEVDERGLERVDRELLEAVAHKFGGGPVGLSTLAVALGEETDTIEDVYEPYLLQLGFLQRTPRGRVITDLGRAHLGATRDEEQPVLSHRPLDTRDGGPARRARRADPAAGRGVQGASTGSPRPRSSVELLDGSLHRLADALAEPGFGFVSFCPHCEDGEPEELIVPLGAIREIRIGAGHEQALGFTAERRGPCGGSSPPQA